MANHSKAPVAQTDVRRTLVSSQMQAANIKSAWREPDYGEIIKGAGQVLETYYKAEKDAAFKRLDIEASKMQLQELEAIRVAENNEQIPEIESNFKNNLSTTFANDPWGKQWLAERGDVFLAANSRDVMRANISKQHELYALEMNKTINTWANDIATSAPDKAKVLMGDMDEMISAAPLLSPEEKQKARDNASALVLQRAISANPAAAVNMLSDDSYNWSEKGIDVEKYKQTALASMKNAENKRLIAQIQNNRAAASDLLAQSQERQLSIDEINKAVPETSKELRALLYDINGYSIEDGELKMSDSQKAIASADIYGRAVALANNKNSSISDWQQLEKDIYSAMRKGGSMSKAEGQKVLNMIATPYMNAYTDKLEDAESFTLIGANFGFGQVEKLIKDLGLNEKIKEKNYKDKTLRENLQGQQAREKIKIYQAYSDNLEFALKEKGYNSIEDLSNKTGREREDFYKGVYDSTLQSLNQAKFSNLQGLLPEQLPNAAVGANDTRISPVSTDINKAKQGTPIQSQYVDTAYDSATGKYGLVKADGSVEEVSYEKYKQFGGIR